MSKRERPATLVITGLCRFSYAHVFTPKAIDENSDPKYSVNLIIPKSDTTTVENIKKAIEAAKAAGKVNNWGGKIPANLKLPLRDGDAERPDDPVYEDAWFINASSKNQPGIVDANREQILDTTEFYSGCYGRASINFYPFAKSGNKGVAAGLNNVQKLKDADKLAGGTSAAEDFADDYDDLDA